MGRSGTVSSIDLAHLQFSKTFLGRPYPWTIHGCPGLEVRKSQLPSPFPQAARGAAGVGERLKGDWSTACCMERKAPNRLTNSQAPCLFKIQLISISSTGLHHCLSSLLSQMKPICIEHDRPLPYLVPSLLRRLSSRSSSTSGCLDVWTSGYELLKDGGTL